MTKQINDCFIFQTSGSLRQPTEMFTRSHQTGPFNVPYGYDNVTSNIAAEGASNIGNAFQNQGNRRRNSD